MTFLFRAAVLVLLIGNAALFAARLLYPPPPSPPAAAGEPEELGAAPPEASADAGPHCFMIGPLATQVQQQRAVDRLRPFADRLRQRTTEADRDRGWWVFVAAANRSAAIATARELAERGVEDYFVVADPELPDAVSLGLYENLDNARRRMAAIRAMGFDAQLSVRREIVPQFWIDYQIEPGARAPWRFILRASPGARRLRIPCWVS